MSSSLSTFPRRLFLMLFAAGLAGVIAALPMTFGILDKLLAARGVSIPIPMPVLYILTVAQNGVIVGVAVGLGLVLSQRNGTGAPILAAIANREPVPEWRRRLFSAAVAGFATGLALAFIDVAIFAPRIPAAIVRLGESVALWKRLLAGVVYGGITEELLFRWFLLSLVAWLFAKISKDAERRPSSAAFWIANAIVAILFGLGHLPMTAMIAPLTTAVVTRALVLNGIAGLVFGYLFWRKGLEAAMVAHACAHLPLQVLGPMLVQFVGEDGA